MAAPKLSVSRLQAGYGDVQVLWDVTIEVGAQITDQTASIKNCHPHIGYHHTYFRCVQDKRKCFGWVRARYRRKTGKFEEFLILW